MEDANARKAAWVIHMGNTVSRDGLFLGMRPPGISKILSDLNITWDRSLGDKLLLGIYYL